MMSNSIPKMSQDIEKRITEIFGQENVQNEKFFRQKEFFRKTRKQNRG